MYEQYFVVFIQINNKIIIISLSVFLLQSVKQCWVPWPISKIWQGYQKLMRHFSSLVGEEFGSTMGPITVSQTANIQFSLSSDTKPSENVP